MKASVHAQKYLRKNLPNEQLRKAEGLSKERANCPNFHTLFISQTDRSGKFDYKFRIWFSNEEHSVAREAAAGTNPNVHKYSAIEAVLARQLLLDQLANAELSPTTHAMRRLKQFAEHIEKIVSEQPDFETDRDAAFTTLQDLTGQFHFERFLPEHSVPGSLVQALIGALRTEVERLKKIPLRSGTYPKNPTYDFFDIDKMAPEDIEECLNQARVAQSPYA